MPAAETAQQDFISAPAPWECKATVYTFFWYITASQAKSLPSSLLYSPLEAASSFASGKAIGGVANVQLIRYDDSPVGPYDEFALLPGTFEYEMREGDQKVKKRNMRSTRLYVSKKDSSFNGRLNWGVPKHLARFEYNDLPSGATEIKIFPHDTTGDLTESAPSKDPFFWAIYKDIPYLPRFPLTTKLAEYIGIDPHMVQPPLPQGQGSQGELPGTDRWMKMYPVSYSMKGSLGWFDFEPFTKQVRSENEATEQSALLNHQDSTRTAVGEGQAFPFWWPSFGRYVFGSKMEDATYEFSKAESWIE